MTILFVVGKFPTVSETFIVNQINSLLSHGHSVIILAVNGYNETGDKTISSHLMRRTFYLQKTSNKRLNFKLFFNALPLRKVGRFLSNPTKYYHNGSLLFEQEIDVIHCHFGDVATIFIERYLSKGYFKNARKIVTFHGYDIKLEYKQANAKKYREFDQYFDAVTCNTPYLKGVVRKTLGDLDIPIITHPVTVNKTQCEKFLPPANNDNRTNTVLFVGRLISLKGVLLLPEIAAELKNRNVEFSLKVIGDGPLMKDLKSLVKLHGLENIVQIMGSLNQVEVFHNYNASKIFILPAVEDAHGMGETQGLVVQEAQFFGLPVLVSDAGGIKYGLIEGKTGFILSQGDIKSFADKIELLLSDEKLRKKMGEEGRKFVLENFTSDALYPELMKIYNK